MSRGAGAGQPSGGGEVPPPTRTAPLRRELYPYSRGSAIMIRRRATVRRRRREEDEEEFITSGNWRGKHNSRRRRRSFREGIGASRGHVGMAQSPIPRTRRDGRDGRDGYPSWNPRTEVKRPRHPTRCFHRPHAMIIFDCTYKVRRPALTAGGTLENCSTKARTMSHLVRNRASRVFDPE